MEFLIIHKIDIVKITVTMYTDLGDYRAKCNWPLVFIFNEAIDIPEVFQLQIRQYSEGDVNDI